MFLSFNDILVIWRTIYCLQFTQKTGKHVFCFSNQFKISHIVLCISSYKNTNHIILFDKYILLNFIYTLNVINYC